MSDQVDTKTQHESMNDGTENQNAIVDPELPSTMLKLNVDCFEELFEWLSLADLRALRRTCKRLKQVADYFIRTNYPAVKLGYGRIRLEDDTFDMLQQYDSTSIGMIKDLRVVVERMTKKEIDIFKVILPQIEKLHIYTYELEGDLHELILKYCSNLKYLSIQTNNSMIGDEQQWLLHQYPLLEHFQLTGFDEDHYIIADLKIFFQLNPNIQIFSISAHFLYNKQDFFLGSNIKIDRLDVNVAVNFDGSSILLNKLYDQGFYKRVHIYVMGISDQFGIAEISSVRGMEKLRLSMIETNITVPPMPNLRELALDNDQRSDDWKTVAENLVNLERVYFQEAESNVITPFLRYAPKLKEIKVVALRDGHHFENGIIDLAALNKERKELIGATKVTIYVHERIFLSTKFAKTKTELKLVTLKRAEAVDWVH